MSPSSAPARTLGRWATKTDGSPQTRAAARRSGTVATEAIGVVVGSDMRGRRYFLAGGDEFLFQLGEFYPAGGGPGDAHQIQTGGEFFLMMAKYFAQAALRAIAVHRVADRGDRGHHAHPGTTRIVRDRRGGARPPP